MPSGPEVITVRIPELSEQLSLSNEDMVAVWVSEDNKTRKASLQSLKEFIEIGDSGTYGPVQTGAHLLYIVPADKEGDNFVSIPGIAGMNFGLKVDGRPLIPQNADPLTPNPDAEYDILSGGGFHLIDNTLLTGQRYELDVYELAAGTSVSISSGGSGSFIQGEVPVNTNINISINDLNKLFQVRGAANSLVITLPDVAQCPERSFVAIECLINNTKQHRITTTGGQYIYINNESRNSLYIGKGEYAWFYKTDEGWFVIIDKGNFTNLAIPKSAYKAGLNQLVCDGSVLNRTDYPRLWEYVQTLGASLVDESTWNVVSVTVAGRTVERPYRGCFSMANGSTTFRVPDLMNMTLRGLKNVGGSDSERHVNVPGVYQKHEVLSHDHDYKTSGGNSPDPIAAFKRSNVSDGSTGAADIIAPYGGSETRMDNIGVLWVIDY